MPKQSNLSMTNLRTLLYLVRRRLALQVPLPPEPGADKGRLVGDVDYAGAQAVATAITPVPGGVGPMTIAVLLRNTLVAAYRNEGLNLPEDAL